MYLHHLIMHALKKTIVTEVLVRIKEQMMVLQVLTVFSIII